LIVHPLYYAGCPVSIDLRKAHLHNSIDAFSVFPITGNILIATHAGNRGFIYRYSLNGTLLAEVRQDSIVRQINISADGKYVFLSSDRGLHILDENRYFISNL
jgi:tricorn protease-like protein